MGSGGRGGVGAAGGLPPPTVKEIHSEEMAWTSGETERRGERGRGSGEVVRRLRLSFFATKRQEPQVGSEGGGGGVEIVKWRKEEGKTRRTK